jgi:uncharacterized LabA/DUF88 family protein
MVSKSDFIPPKNKNDLTPLLSSLIKNKRVSVFIDSANLYYASSTANLKIDYFQAARWFQSHCNLTGLNFYTAYDPFDQKQQDFFNDLEKSGYRLIKKPIKVFADSIKGNMDIELAVDALLHKDTYDILILISGDGDFHYLVRALENIGKNTIILGVGGFTSFELHQEAHNYFFLNRIASVWKKSYRSRSAHGNQETQHDDNEPLPLHQKLVDTTVHTKPQAKEKNPKNLKVKVKLNPKPKIFLS